MLKKLFLVVVGIVAVLAAVVLFNALRLRPEPIEVEAASPIEIDGDAAVQRFAGAIRLRTVSNENVEDTDSAAFRALHDYFAASYPLVHEKLKRELVADLSLLYTWEGTDPSLEPVVLMGHQDVVPVIPGTEGDWDHPPFSGDVADGFVWGRGTMDDKVSVVSVLEAVEGLLEQGFRPRRTIYLAFGHDEEVGGTRGAAAIADLLAQRGAGPYAFVIDEGGMIVEDMVPGVPGPVALVGIAEKGYVSMELLVEGDGGHSSMPPPETNIGVLAEAITRLEQSPFPAKLEGATRDLFEALAPHMSLSGRVALGNLWLFEPLLVRALARDEMMSAMLRTTTAPTIIEGGVKANVLPIRARAIVNHRIMPGETPETVRDRDVAIIDDARVHVSISQTEAQPPSPVSDPSGPAFQLLARTIVQNAGEELVVAPWLLVGGTDSKYYSAESKNVFRFIPARVDANATTRIHGTNERMSIDSYLASIHFFQRLIRNSDQLQQ